jgi:Ca2+-binding EF-hand superfamily protein
MSVKGVLTKDSFRDGLGLLGLEYATFISDRLFNIIDCSGDGSIDFDEYLQYLAVVLNGTEVEKAAMSFRFLDIRKSGKLLYNDFEKLIYGISIFWNTITGSKGKNIKF